MKRIQNSIIDQDLFSNDLAWGVNVDGFTLFEESNEVNAIYEKRINTFSEKYSVKTYDPGKFFFGTRNRSGDFPSWDILFKLSKKFNVSLILLTFDTSLNKTMGASEILNVTRDNGLKYFKNLKPYENLFVNDLSSFEVWLKARLAST